MLAFVRENVKHFTSAPSRERRPPGHLTPSFGRHFFDIASDRTRRFRDRRLFRAIRPPGQNPLSGSNLTPEFETSTPETILIKMSYNGQSKLWRGLTRPQHAAVPFRFVLRVRAYISEHYRDCGRQSHPHTYLKILTSSKVFFSSWIVVFN